jgi:hypothetical protein
MSDGVDGLSGGFMVITLSCVGIMALAGGNVHIANFIALLICSLLAFLTMNFRRPWKRKALVYLGDAGHRLRSQRRVYVPAIFEPVRNLFLDRSQLGLAAGVIGHLLDHFDFSLRGDGFAALLFTDFVLQVQFTLVLHRLVSIRLQVNPTAATAL